MLFKGVCCRLSLLQGLFRISLGSNRSNLDWMTFFWASTRLEGLCMSAGALSCHRISGYSTLWFILKRFWLLAWQQSHLLENHRTVWPVQWGSPREVPRRTWSVASSILKRQRAPAGPLEAFGVKLQRLHKQTPSRSHSDDGRSSEHD